MFYYYHYYIFFFSKKKKQTKTNKKNNSIFLTCVEAQFCSMILRQKLCFLRVVAQSSSLQDVGVTLVT